MRRQIGSVLQSTGALQASIFENISGARFITHDQAWDAAKRVGIDDDIEALPMQMETYLGSDGGGLSTGQRQRIAIARASSRRRASYSSTKRPARSITRRKRS